jgi:hypothetical protein
VKLVPPDVELVGSDFHGGIRDTGSGYIILKRSVSEKFNFLPVWARNDIGVTSLVRAQASLQMAMLRSVLEGDYAYGAPARDDGACTFEAGCRLST